MVRFYYFIKANIKLNIRFNCCAFETDSFLFSLAQFAGEDPVVALEAALQFEDTKESMHAFCVGQYMEVTTLNYLKLEPSKKKIVLLCHNKYGTYLYFHITLMNYES